MGQIVKFPVQASKLGYTRARKRGRGIDPNQLDLFPSPGAQILEFTPAAGWFEQALALDERGDARAAEFYLKAIEQEDCVADAWCNLGILESRNGNTIRAFDCFTCSLKHNPRHFEAHYNLGNLYFDANDFRLAQLHYELAVEVNPSFANAYFNLALVHAIHHDPAAAVRVLSRYQELVPVEEARNAARLLEDLKESIAAVRSRSSRTAPQV
ncbi:MAG TPA: tetratricopeptide repeat protein [Verrucomicrobia bacterium]|mgnify:CR=1 FL=1|nr:tetratricopeptide repeat protein [Verrucomicrobiota bacterium]HOB34088.1 tetratricopeptide repeat protein [Verrucomicrobiota bacterium]HOP98432.1 tetratricopeptide repeat protein [Verrucomicrobiota bacterium]HPU56538.1 tetratricopeptide repeat protein [Verrucomicrobiota bacterium]